MNLFLLTINDNGVEKVKYLKEKKSFCKLFSYDKLSEKVQEVPTTGFMQEDKVIHSKGEYDENKIYLQARSIFEANVKFKQFFENKNENHNQENKELPQTPGL